MLSFVWEIGVFVSFMKAIVVKAPGGDFELVDKEIPEPKENEVLIKVSNLWRLPWRCNC